jgi:hypothetical protein
MGLRRARELVVLMAKEFQPYGATWAELMHKSGSKPTSYKRAFNWAMGKKWFVGGGKQGAAYYLNPDGCWRAAPGPASSGPSSDPVRTLDSNSSKIDSIVVLASEAIRYADQKKRSEG